MRKRQTERRGRLSTSKLAARSQSTRDLALHVLAAMRRDPKLSLSRAAKLQGIKSETVRKYFPKDFRKSKGKFHVTKSDRHTAILYIVNEHGEYVPVQTHSSKERKQAGQHKRDLNRYQRGQGNALLPWRDKEIAGIRVLTDPATIKAIESTIAEFSLYKTYSGGAA